MSQPDQILQRPRAEIAAPYRAESDILTNALALHAAGFSFMPANPGKWLNNWTRFGKDRITEEQVRTYFGGDQAVGTDIDVFCGPISGDVYCVEFDNHTGRHADLYDRWVATIPPDLHKKLCVFKTKTAGGYRVVWRCDTEPVWYGDSVAVVLDNQTPRPVVECLTHFKAPGGSTVAYQYVSGPTLTDLSEYISVAEQDALLDAAARFHEYDAPKRAYIPSPTGGTGTDDRPGAYYDRHADWRDVLEPAGWWFVKSAGGTSHWTRPGGGKGKTSATTGHAGANKLYCFSSDAHPLVADESYTPFQALALLHFGGDFGKAARAITTSGWGPVKPYCEWQAEQDAAVADKLAALFAAPTPVPAVQNAVVAAAPAEPEFDPNKYAVRYAPLLRWSEIKRRAAADRPTWVIQNVIASGEIQMPCSLPWGGKSTILAHAVASVIQGKPFFGHATVQVPVLYLNADRNGYELFHSRLAPHLDGEFGDEAMEKYFFAPEFEKLQTPFPGDYIDYYLDQIAAETGDATVWVIVDTLRAGYISGAETGSENDSSFVVTVLTPLRRTAIRRNCAITTVHHNNKAADDYAGSAGIAGCVDTFLRISRDPEATVSTLKISNRRGYHAKLFVKRHPDGTLTHTDDNPDVAKKEGDELNEFIDKFPATVQEAWTRDQAMERLDLKEGTFRNRIKGATVAGRHPRLEEVGTGTKSNPYKYFRVGGG